MSSKNYVVEHDEYDGGKSWHNCPPPFIGWWWTTVNNQWQSWRWWDGTAWSLGITEKEEEKVSIDTVSWRAFHPTEHDTSRIWWSWVWPSNARVGRLLPLETTA